MSQLQTQRISRFGALNPDPPILAFLEKKEDPPSLGVLGGVGVG